MKKHIFIITLIFLLITAQSVYADFYSQTLSIGSDGNEYKENIINTTPLNTQQGVVQPYSTVQVVQPIIYPATYYTQPIYRYPSYPYSYINYNKGGLSIGYNNMGYNNNYMHPYHPTINTNTRSLSPSFGKSYYPVEHINTNNYPIKPIPHHKPIHPLK